MLLERGGELTCPVKTLAVMAGTIDCRSLANKTSAEVREVLMAAVRQANKRFAGLRGANDARLVRDRAGSGELPRIGRETEQMAGSVIQFDRRSDFQPSGSQSVEEEEEAELASWELVLWAKFNDAAGGRRFFNAHHRELREHTQETILTVQPEDHVLGSPEHSSMGRLARHLSDRIRTAGRSRRRSRASDAPREDVYAMARSVSLQQDMVLPLDVATDLLEGAEQQDRDQAGLASTEADESAVEGNDRENEQEDEETTSSVSGDQESGADDSEDLGESSSDDSGSESSFASGDEPDELLAEHMMFRER